MQVISQEISTSRSSMTIIHSEERAFWPFLFEAVLRFLNIENDWDSILIIISNYSLICICGISWNKAVFFNWTFRRFVIWNDNSLSWLQIHQWLFRMKTMGHTWWFYNAWIRRDLKINHFSFSGLVWL